MKAFANPLVLRMALALPVSLLALLAGVSLVRRLLRRFMPANPGSGTHPDAEQFPLHAFNDVIQELKQQKHELLADQQAERRRYKTSESISAAVVSRLPSGVLFFTPNGLVRQANSAAKKILGFASPSGMSADELFRDATLTSDSGSPQTLAEAIHACLREHLGTKILQAQYLSPTGDQRILEVTLTLVSTQSADVLGVACLIEDKTEMTLMQKRQELRGQMSDEMALALRTSVAMISGCARQIAVGRDPEQAQQLLADIISEAAQLDQIIGGFLTGTGKMTSAAGV